MKTKCSNLVCDCNLVFGRAKLKEEFGVVAPGLHAKNALLQTHYRLVSAKWRD